MVVPPVVLAYVCTALNTSIASVDLVDVGDCTYKASSYGSNSTEMVQVMLYLHCFHSSLLPSLVANVVSHSCCLVW